MRILGELIVSLICGGFSCNILTKRFLATIHLGDQGTTIVGFLGGLLCVQLHSASGSPESAGTITNIGYSALGGGAAICFVGSLWKLIVMSYALKRGLCPHCRGADTYPSLPESVWGKIASRILLRPIGCHCCMGRHYRPAFLRSHDR
jgi:hypothetical protein